MIAARVLPLRPQRSHRGQRLPRRFPPTLRSIPTHEASGAPAPAAPPPSSMGAPPAAPPASSAPPASPPPPPVPESGERARPVIEALSRTHDELVSQMAFALGYLDMASDFSRKIRSFLAGTPDPSDVAFAQDAVVVVDEQLDSLRDVLREISSTLTGVESNASLAEHAARLGQLTAYSDGVFLRSSRLQEALKAFAGG